MCTRTLLGYCVVAGSNRVTETNEVGIVDPEGVRDKAIRTMMSQFIFRSLPKEKITGFRTRLS